MTWVESLQKAIDYIEEHLLEELSMETIAKQAHSSAFHFQRTFSLLTDVSVGEYIRRRRLTLAAQELSRSNEKIIDLAYKYGYDTPEAFSKAFRRQHGVSPSGVRKYTGKLTFYHRLIIQVSLKGAEPMQYKIVDHEGFQVVGMKQEFSCLNGENMIGISKMWGEVNQNGTSNQLVSLNNGILKGLLGVCVDKSKEKSNALDYWIAVAHKGEAVEGFEVLEIPASKWAIFEVHGPMPEAMQNRWKQIISEWFPTSGYQHAGTPDLEVYTGPDVTSPDYYSEIWIPIK
ncbi:AraC family transcriptional regulator [Caldalkalibacillus mannanilyticus]|uniref:AraC family transcriptional regulator n=1 Tax=Caldalkalibacillus mannanilyticus TaxID=1418 RepID=UPI000468B7EB|nr:AraC family transcriptional regulator [Caldalkalibacillus mannanilyticus]